MGGPIGAGMEGWAEALVEDPVDQVAESNQHLHGLESPPNERALNGRDVSSS
jgi:hypothetical protein